MNIAFGSTNLQTTGLLNWLHRWLPGCTVEAVSTETARLQNRLLHYLNNRNVAMSERLEVAKGVLDWAQRLKEEHLEELVLHMEALDGSTILQTLEGPRSRK